MSLKLIGFLDAAAWPIEGLFMHFHHEMEDRITHDRGRRGNAQGASQLAAA